MKIISTFLFISTLLVSQVSVAGDNGRTDLKQRFLATMEHLTETGQFSGTAILARNGQVVSRFAGGRFDDDGHPVTLDTLFNIGSIGKLITQALVLKQVEAGHMKLSQTVADLWPDSGLRNADRITVKQLLNHSSGYGNYFEAEGYSLEQRTLEDFLELLRQTPLDFDNPGSEMTYSNSAFWILAALLERADPQHRDWQEQMRQEIARPLNTRFHLFQPDDDVAERPQGYYLDPVGGRKAVSAVDEEPRPGPDGGEYMTAADLFRFQQALLDGELYSEAMLDLSSQPMTNFAGLNCKVGLVWELCPDGDRHFRTKGGTITGGGSMIADWEEGGDRYSLVMLSNYHNAPMRHYQGIAELLMNPSQPVPEGHPLKTLWQAVQDGSWKKVTAAPEQWFQGRGSLNGVTSLPLLALYAYKQGYAEAAAALLEMNLWRYPDSELSERLLERIQPSKE